MLQDEIGCCPAAHRFENEAKSPTLCDVPNTDDTDDNADGEDDRTSPPVRGGMWVWKLRAELDKGRLGATKVKVATTAMPQTCADSNGSSSSSSSSSSSKGVGMIDGVDAKLTNNAVAVAFTGTDSKGSRISFQASGASWRCELYNDACDKRGAMGTATWDETGETDEACGELDDDDATAAVVDNGRGKRQKFVVWGEVPAASVAAAACTSIPLPVVRQLLAIAHRSLAKIFFINHDNMVVEGIAAVTAAALLFGVVAALVKYADVHSLILLQFRSAVQLALSLTAVKLCLPEKQWSQMFGPHELWPGISGRGGWVPVGVPAVSGDSAAAHASWYHIGMFSAFCSAVAAGLLPALTRKSKEVHWATVELWAASTSCLIFTPCSLVVWLHTQPNAFAGAGDSVDARYNDYSNGYSRVAELQTTLAAVLQFQDLFGIMLLLSLIGFTGLGLQTYGYQHEEAARASMMTFLEVPFAYVLQWQLFDDVLNRVQAAGMVLIVGSCAVTVWNKLQA
eukprot:gene7863-28557_t